MKVIYIVGPFTAATAWDIECNVRKAEEAALLIAQLGAMPLCPHTNTRFFHGQLTSAFWYEGTMELMRRCDAVFAIDRWSFSHGSEIEIYEAIRRGMPFFDASMVDKLIEYINS
jgi:hypothetical protein